MLQEIKEELTGIADLLYQENTGLAYQKLTGIIPKMSLALGEVSDEDKKNMLVAKLSLALEAMENEDNLLLADVIQYELLDAIDEL